jgi:DNA-binding NarL/FixJ family response regulator
MISIVLADDNRAVRKGLKTLLVSEAEFSVIGEAENGLDAVELVSDHRPDVLILDLMMPGISGLEVTRRLHRHSPQTRIIVLSMYSSEAYVAESLRCGAKGYILKESPPEELLTAIREVLQDRCYLSPPLSETSLQRYISETKPQGTNHDR